MSEPVPVTPFSEEDIRAHAEHDHIAAVFADHASAEAAVEELRSLGLGSEHLGVAVHGDESVVFEHDEQREFARDTVTGIGKGVPPAVIAGITLAAVAIPGLGVGGILAAAGGAAIWGAVLGGYAGAAAGTKGWIEHEDMRYTALQPGEVLVVVCSHGHPDAIRAVIDRHDGRLVEAPGAAQG